MSVRRRLAGSFGATLLGPLITLVVQLVNVPVMLTYWGAHLYGEWLILTAVPTYLLLSDMGFGNVAGTDMTMRLHAGDGDGALETLHSTTALVLTTALVIGLMLILLCVALPVGAILHLEAIGAAEAHTTLLLLGINCLVILQWSVLMAGYRASGHYARGMLYVNVVRIVEAASFLVVLTAHARPPQLAMVMLGVSVVGTAWIVRELRRLAPELPLGLGRATLARVKQLTRPAFAFMAFPAGNALTTQGMTLCVGLILGPAAVALLNPMRTLARTAFQLTDAVKNSVWAELSAAYGNGDWMLARRLHRAAFQLSLMMTAVTLPLLALAGPSVFRSWTHGRVSFDRGAFYLLLLSVLANSLWNASSAVAMAANRHERMSIVYLAATAGSIGLAAVLLRRIGLAGAPAAMLCADVVMSVYVVRMSNRLLGEQWGDFRRSMGDFAAVRSMLVKLRSRVA